MPAKKEAEKVKVRNLLPAGKRAELLLLRDAMLVAPHIKEKKGASAFAEARRIIKSTGRKPRRLGRVVELALQIKCG
jgi:hypothetical protein